jgi:site-specific recombinase XerD
MGALTVHDGREKAALSRPRDTKSPAAVYVARLGPGSRRGARASLKVLAELATGAKANPITFPWEALRYEHAQALRSMLAEKYKASSANTHLAHLRGVLQEAWRLGLMNGEDLKRTCDFKPVKGSTLPAGRDVAQAELERVFMAMGTSPAGIRDAALLSTLYTGGLRRSEAVALDVAHAEEDGSLRVRGKGNKERTAYADAAHLAAWLRVRGPSPGPLFCPVLKNGRVVLRRMTDTAVYQVLQRATARAASRHFSPHDLRRSFVTHLLDNGADVLAVQSLVGHANLDTTKRYDRRGEASKKAVARLLKVPPPKEATQ